MISKFVVICQSEIMIINKATKRKNENNSLSIIAIFQINLAYGTAQIPDYLIVEKDTMVMMPIACPI